MRELSADHPKARLMVRKRRAILEAARETFLSRGYSGTSMEAVAATAGVSIMTLYRHAESKDDLFAAVIAQGCEVEGGDHRRRMDEVLARPLEEVLASVGDMFQARLSDPQTIALFRAVMAETERFPHLGPLAYRGLIGVHVDMLDEFLARHAEASALAPADRQTAASEFLGGLLGLSYIGSLLGSERPSDDLRQARSARAVATLMAALPHPR